MKDLNETPVEEIPFLESFFITGYVSSYHYRGMNSYQHFKKIIKNDSNDAFKINAKAHQIKVTGKALSQKSSELFDDIVDHPEKLKIDSEFVKTLKLLSLYPNVNFSEWNQHVEIYNSLEKSNFSQGNAIEMYLFLRESFFIDTYKNFINLDLLMYRDFNIFLILFHLDSLIFNENFQSISLFKYLLIGKIKGKRKPSIHLFWNLVKVIACIESNKRIGTSFDISKKVPKDEDSFSLVNALQAERIIYAVRQIKERKRFFFFLSHIYQIVGAKKLHEDTTCFKGFSLTGLWLIYIYSQLLIRPDSKILKLSTNEVDILFEVFNNKYRSSGTNQWPSDLLNYK